MTSVLYKSSLVEILTIADSCHVRGINAGHFELPGGPAPVLKEQSHSWRQGCETVMARNPIELESLSKVVLFFLVICINWTALDAQRTGFLSIDCGTAEDHYNDSITGLHWVSDTQYILTGMNSNGPFQINATTFDMWNYKALGDFRYFPEPRSKHCYELPSQKNVSYLIRAMFYYDDSQSDLLNLPIQFNVSINSTNWFTMMYSKDTNIETPNYKEGIFYSPGSIIYFCLVPVIGTPFISSLELRRLDLDGIMYSFPYSTKTYLSNLIREDTGSNTSLLRYPDDSFDRLWIGTYGDPSNVQYPPQLDGNATSASMNYIPAKVMQNAFEYSNTTRLSTSSQLSLPSTVSYVYVVMYFQFLNASDPGIQQDITVTINGDQTFPPFTVTDSAIKQAYPHVFQTGSGMEIDLYSPITQPGPILNALEVYEENIFDFSLIDPQDGKAITAFKTSFNLTDWQADPCTPVPYDWLTCALYYWQFCKYCIPYWLVTSIKLSNLPGKGLGFSRLQSIYHHSDNQSIHPPDSLFYSLLALSELDQTCGMAPLKENKSLTYNYISDSTFQFILDNIANNGSLTTLDLSHNDIKTLPAAVHWNYTTGLAFLNLSFNALEGDLSSFADSNYPFTDTIQQLNLSYNSLTSLPTKWANTFQLEVLDLSHNNLSGEISSLDILVKRSMSLQEIYISDNNFMGVFNSLLYFSNATNLSIGYFDRNQIHGTLDLSTWHASLLQAAKNTSASTTSLIFSFVDNNITDIFPDAQDFQPTIDTLLKIKGFNQSGVFLGGNPYCKGAKTKTKRYLCRSTNKDPYIIPDKKGEHIIVAIVGGIFAFLVGCACLATIGKLWTKVSTLQKIQQALVDQKVHPPLFSYSDLKLASRDFHKNNKLGQGAFGVVYKGMLADGTTVAVKKLYNTQQVQVLNEFLNEVVLITGIKHRNLLQLKGCCINDKQRILVYEFVANGNLAEALWDKKANRGILDWQQRFNICLGVARGLSYLHEELNPRIIHRDIKPANILLDTNFYPKIADFGLARPFLDEQSQANSTQVAGTMGYWAPEYATQGQLTDKVDVFSFGTLVLEIISGRKCIDYNKPQDEVFLRDWALQLHKDGKLLELLQHEVRLNCIEDDVIRVINIALICVQPDPKKRATMSQVVTMLLGSMDVTVLLDIKKDKRPNFDTLLANNNYYGLKNTSTQPAYEVITEEYEESPFLNIKSTPQLTPSSSSTTAMSIELGPMSGR